MLPPMMTSQPFAGPYSGASGGGAAARTARLSARLARTNVVSTRRSWRRIPSSPQGQPGGWPEGDMVAQRPSNRKGPGLPPNAAVAVEIRSRLFFQAFDDSAEQLLC